ncbi:hypothetical protein SMBr_30890 [Shewanella sp. M-Br]|nr:hypothetical protein SMBr_30890 [Shewanella sp. M-Br]
MLTDKSLIEITASLLEQRHVLVRSRYTNRQLLMMHDQKLMRGLNELLRRKVHVTEHRWLDWVLDCSPIPFDSAFGVNPPHALWLTELKMALHNMDYAGIAMSAQKDNAEYANWLLASYLHIPIPNTDKLLEQHISSAMLWYLASMGCISKKAALNSAIRNADPRLSVEIKLALYMLGDRTDELELLSCAIENEISHWDYLFVLICGAPEPLKIRLLNLICSEANDKSASFRAIGFSGLSKFIPMVLALTKEQETENVAMDVLYTLVGTVEAEVLLSQLDLIDETSLELVVNKYPSLTKLQVIDTIELKTFWQLECQGQRQAAAYRAKVHYPQTPLARPCRLLGGIWHLQ